MVGGRRDLPPGLTLNPASGALTGTPTAAGTYTFTVRVQDGSRSDSKQLTIAIRDPLAITAPAIPLEEVGVALLQPLRLVATGGTGAYAWKIESGTLPGGLSFDAPTAQITGTPLAAGSYPVMVSATDTEGRTATVSVILTVKAVLEVRTRRLRPHASVDAIARRSSRAMAWARLAGGLSAGDSL